MMAGLVKLSDFNGNLWAALQQLSNGEGCIIIDEASRFPVAWPEYVVPEGVELRFCPGGVMGVIGKLAIQGLITAGPFQIFELRDFPIWSASVSNGPSGRTTRALPEWWGGDKVGQETYWDESIQHAVDFLAESGGTVHLRSKTYVCQGPIQLRDGVDVVGSGRGTLAYQPPQPSELDAFVHAGPPTDEYKRIRLENVDVVGDVAWADLNNAPLTERAQVGVSLDTCRALVKNVQVRGFAAVALEIIHGAYSSFEQVRASTAKVCMRIGSRPNPPLGATTTQSFTTCQFSEGHAAL